MMKNTQAGFPVIPNHCREWKRHKEKGLVPALYNESAVLPARKVPLESDGQLGFCFSQGE